MQRPLGWLESLPNRMPSVKDLTLGSLLVLGGFSEAFHARMAEAATPKGPHPEALAPAPQPPSQPTPPPDLGVFPVSQLDTEAMGSMDFPTWGLELKEIPNESLWRLQQAEKELQKKGFKGGKYFAVDVEHQVFGILETHEDGSPASLLGAWPTSTAKKGLGTESGSEKTPAGVFELKTVDGRGGKIGVVRAREGYGQTVNDLETGGGQKPTMTTRFIAMYGLEPHNANTAARDIGLHGTNYEARLGTPDSGGCIRLDNDTIILVSAIMMGNDGDTDPEYRRDFLAVIDDKAAPYTKVPASHTTGTYKIPSANGEGPWSDQGWE